MKIAVLSTLALITVASAQITSCVSNCFATSATAASCSSYADASCVCGNTAYESAASSCLANCTAAEQQNATTLQQDVCGSIGAATASVTSTSLAEAGTAASSTATASGALRDYAAGYGRAGAAAVVGVLGVVAGGGLSFREYVFEETGWG